jgi:large subunit ribosomal protein L21
MRAVVKAGGKQYCVAQGDKITVEKLDGKAGDKVALETLMVGTKLGAGTVEAEIVEQGRGDKVIIFKKKRRQNYRRKNGHRQDQTLVKITSVQA